jgi:1-aminocyclopropane-1-carboxylate deaminase/D-cysteine desulfhydrase-like pyridoxal-dependent ACC family enzyme
VIAPRGTPLHAAECILPGDTPGVHLKRDDLFTIAGVSGGKVRTCWHLATRRDRYDGPAKGLITAGSRQSPQVNIVAHIARELGLPCRVHVPKGRPTPELEDAAAAGAEIVPHFPGYNTVIVSRARADAEAHPGWREIPFGMECREAVDATAHQFAFSYAAMREAGVERIVVPVGSGMSLAGILLGRQKCDAEDIDVLGVSVGADPLKRLTNWGPFGWNKNVLIVSSGLDYHKPLWDNIRWGVTFDPIYEAKCLAHVQPGDLFWVVGIRRTAEADHAEARP